MDLLNLSSLAFSPWLGVLAAAFALALAALLVYRIGVVIVSRAVQRSAAATVVARSARKPAGLLLPLIAIQFAWHSAPDTLGGVEVVRHITLVLLIATSTWLLTRGIRAFGEAVVITRPSDGPDNLEARRVHTQTRVLTRSLMFIVGLIGFGMIVMTFPGVRQIGASLLASAGVAGLIVGIAARPVLGNLIAGLQIGLTQPIRLDDVVIVQGEWGWVEEITGSYVVVRLWDQRRLIVPLQWWIENPFQNWTRISAELVGSVFLWVDYRMPLEPLREQLKRACEQSADWDRRVCLLQVTEAGEHAMQLRALVSSADSPRNWDLRCHVREQLLAFLQREYPQYLPNIRQQVDLRHDGAKG